MAIWTCPWVLAGGDPCGQRLGWTMVPDGGEPGAALVRKYKTFCHYHELKAKEQAAAEDAEELDEDLDV